MINLNIIIQMMGDDLKLDFKPIRDSTSNDYEQFLCDEILKKIKDFTEELVNEALSYEEEEDTSYSVVPNSTLKGMPSANAVIDTPIKNSYNKNNIFTTGLLKIAYVYTFKDNKNNVIKDGDRDITYNMDDPAFAREFKQDKKILITRVQAHDYFTNPIKIYSKIDVIENVKNFLLTGKNDEGNVFAKEAVADLDFDNSTFIEFYEEENIWWNRDKEEMDNFLDQYNKHKKITGLYNDGICYLRIPLLSDPNIYVNFYFNYFDCNNKIKHIKDTTVILVKSFNKRDEDPLYSFGKNLVSLEYSENYDFIFKDIELKKFLKSNK